MSSSPVANPVRDRLDRATEVERAKLSEALKLKPLQGGAAQESRLEVAYFEAFDRARPKLATGYLSYGAALATAHLLMVSPKKQEFVGDVVLLRGFLSRAFSGEQAPKAASPHEPEESLASVERQLLAHAERLCADGKAAGVDPVRAAIKIGSPAFPLLLGGAFGLAFSAVSIFGSSWDFDMLESLVKSSILLAGVGERLRLEALISSSHQSSP